MSRPRLFLSHDAGYDWLSALEFGRIDDGQPAERWREVDEQLGFLLDRPGGREVGFKLLGLSEFDPGEDPGVLAELDGPEAPRFDVPALMLTDATAGRIIPAAREFFGGENSVNRDFFDRGTECGGEDQREQALYWWRCCVQAGDMMGLFAIGYTLYDLGDFEGAVRHLRHYVELGPAEPWNWCWLGKAEAAAGAPGRARRAYEQAIALTEAGGSETDAPELLAALDGERE